VTNPFCLKPLLHIVFQVALQEGFFKHPRDVPAVLLDLFLLFFSISSFNPRWTRWWCDQITVCM